MDKGRVWRIIAGIALALLIALTGCAGASGVPRGGPQLPSAAPSLP